MHGAFFASPRVRGEAGFYAQRKIRVRGSFSKDGDRWTRGESPSPLPSPRKNGEREKSYAPAAFFAITLR
ncbi:hypothetical protein DAA51_32215 [Bradyrhizobium sp. WBAH10]|nr:hypothetical protein [Bradyrhizobium sp. WBAH30]MDD1542411.1 hypothetical protein [Bradyrhizobium sp. WBAH41]MDD1556563.1 hypothetical protein [Bradyrhizobium sp. WBAH23]MDD1589382.1 hypothetical protein [Bradyrhizobium sp. WBAH42]NRB87879.1 hypothetical protein [Bradyrhizobium sp. WBAH10]QCJ92679.1 hypothetical protein DAA57_32460 [Bradyrhizobium yuanmingense]